MPLPPLSAWNEARALAERAEAKRPPKEVKPLDEQLLANAQGFDVPVQSIDSATQVQIATSEATNLLFDKDDGSGQERWKIQVTMPDDQTVFVRLVRKG